MENDPFIKLFEFISNSVLLKDIDIERIHSKLSIENYSKGDFILKQNQVSKTLKFVISGVYRVYQIKEGKEITSYFNYGQRNPFSRVCKLNSV